MSGRGKLAVFHGIVWIGIGLWLGACSNQAPAPPRPEPRPPRVETPAVKAEPVEPSTVKGPHGIEIFESPEWAFACHEVKGIPYAHMGDEIEAVKKQLEEQGIEPAGFSRTQYLDDPREVDASGYRYRVGFPVASDALIRRPMQRRVIPAQLMARVRHHGRYDEDFQVRFYEEIPQALKKMGYEIHGPILEIYEYPVVEKDPKNWVTELRYPVVKPEPPKAEPTKKPVEPGPAR